jgi:hypothetical protein
MNSMSHIGRYKEGTLDSAFKTIDTSSFAFSQQFIDTVERLVNYVRARTLCRLGTTLLVVKKSCNVDETSIVFDFCYGFET